jgi:hypothetical protein
MNKEQLKELVKAHFNLVDHSAKQTFGEVFDENKAFKIVFPGDELKVGDKVKVVTTEGQEMDAPDGFHKLEDGKTIKTENSVVTEIAEFDASAADEGELERKAQEEIEEMFAADPAISQVEGTTAQNASTNVNPDVTANIKTEADVQAEEMMKKIKMAVDEEIASTITGIKEEMKSMKEKLEKLAASPAKEKTMMSSSNTEKFNSNSLQAPQMKVMRELLKNKNK